jgi:hypothetical protein
MERFHCWERISHFFFGTFLPAFRALESPIAIACFLLGTFLPLVPLRNLPSFLAFISVLTLLPAAFEYLRFDAFLAVVFVVMNFLVIWDDARDRSVAWRPTSLGSQTCEILKIMSRLNEVRKPVSYGRGFFPVNGR